MNNAQTLADLRYFAQHALPENRSSFESSLRDFAAALISPPAQKPASVPGGSGAGLVGDFVYDCVYCGAPSLVDPSDQSPPRDYCTESDHGFYHDDGTYCAPVTMSGDAWESAAHHVLALRDAKPVNADTWHQIGEFLSSLPQKAPEPCLFPQPFHRKNDYLIGTGTEPLFPRGHCELRQEFGIVATIDAPNLLPRGGSISVLRFGSFDGSTFEAVICSRGRS